jgi:hypothetical protein
VSELGLVFSSAKQNQLLTAKWTGAFRTYLNIRANHLCLLPRGDPGLLPELHCPRLQPYIVRVSEFVHRVKAPYPIEEDDGRLFKKYVFYMHWRRSVWRSNVEIERGHHWDNYRSHTRRMVPLGGNRKLSSTEGTVREDLEGKLSRCRAGLGPRVWAR